MLQFCEQVDLVKSAAIDYMHAMLLGVMYRLLCLWFTNKLKGQPYHLNDKKKTILERRFLSVKPCRFVNRLPRPFKNLSKFKASEYRSLLLFYFPVILDGLLPRKYLDHFKLLSSSVYLLLQSNISQDDLRVADEKLKTFVNEFQQFYGKEHMVMNIHILLHLVDCVKSLGPLWSFSLFTYESFNAEFKRYLGSSKDVLHTITMKYILKHAALLAETEHPDKSKKGEKLIVPTSVDWTPHLTEALMEANIDLKSDNEFMVFSALKRQSEIYTSIKYTKAKKTIDYFISTNDCRYGRVLFYAKYDGQNIAIIDEYIVLSRENQVFNVKSSGKVFHCKTSHIGSKLIYMNVRGAEYLVGRPNSFEKS